MHSEYGHVCWVALGEGPYKRGTTVLFKHCNGRHKLYIKYIIIYFRLCINNSLATCAYLNLRKTLHFLERIREALHELELKVMNLVEELGLGRTGKTVFEKD